MTITRQMVFAKRPTGAITLDTFRLTETKLTALNDGDVLVKNLWLSLDPYMRGRLSDAKSYVDRKSTRLNSSHIPLSRMPSSA